MEKSGFLDLSLVLDPRDYCLLGLLLDSAEGLATHSHSRETNELEIMVSESQRADLLRFLSIWESYRAGLPGKSPAPRGKHSAESGAPADKELN